MIRDLGRLSLFYGVAFDGVRISSFGEKGGCR